MGERQTYLWRILVTGACFVLFGSGGLILGLIVFPVVLLLPGGPARRRARTRGMVQRAFRLFVATMSGLGGISYVFQGSERLGRQGQLIIANHPTLIDVVLIVAFTPAPACVVKAALFANPFTRRVVRAAGYISNAPTDSMVELADRDPPVGRYAGHVPGGHADPPGPADGVSSRGREHRHPRRVCAHADLHPGGPALPAQSPAMVSGTAATASYLDRGGCRHRPRTLPTPVAAQGIAAAQRLATSALRTGVG